MNGLRETNLSGRERRRLAQARENGYLRATGAGQPALLKAYGLWCWLLKIPMVWYQRRTPRSRYGSVWLDLLTTANMLTLSGQSEIRNLGARASPHDACWEKVPVRELESLAKAAYRTATRAGNCQPNRPKLLRIRSGAPARILPIDARRAASG